MTDLARALDTVLLASERGHIWIPRVLEDVRRWKRANRWLYYTSPSKISFMTQLNENSRFQTRVTSVYVILPCMVYYILWLLYSFILRIQLTQYTGIFDEKYINFQWTTMVC